MSARVVRAWSWSASKLTRAGHFLFMFLLGPFLDKRLLAHDPPIKSGSMHRFSVFAFTVAMCYRLVALRVPLGWPDAITVFVVVFALALNYLLVKSSPDTTIAAVTGMFAAAKGALAPAVPAQPDAPLAATEGMLQDEDGEPVG